MKRKGTVGSLGECNQTGRRPSPHEGRRAFPIFDPPSMEPCRGEHTAGLASRKGPHTTNDPLSRQRHATRTPPVADMCAGLRIPPVADICGLPEVPLALAIRIPPVADRCGPPEGLPLSRPRATGCADLPQNMEMSARAGH